MIEAMIAKVRALDPDREFQALLVHVSVTSPIALELLAHEHLDSTVQEARRIAGIQLRVVREFAGRLEWLDGVCSDSSLAPGLRVALASVLRNLCAEAELPPVIDSEAAVLLEPALLFHATLARLRPWLPPTIVALEGDDVLELLQLGIPDYLHPLLRQRFELMWTQFHQLRQLPHARLSIISDTPELDDVRIQRLLDECATAAAPTPPPPSWLTLSWVSPWVAEERPHPIRRPRAS